MTKPVDSIDEVSYNVSMERMYQKALDFATVYHGGQFRKFVADEPYIYHPMHVARIVARVLPEDHEAIAAALLHDVVEDTSATTEMILEEFGPRVAELVAEVTKVSEPEDGNRALRKNMDREHYVKGSPVAQTIKLADIIANTTNFFNGVPVNFMKKYVPEQLALAEELTAGDAELRKKAIRILTDAALAMLPVKKFDDIFE